MEQKIEMKFVKNENEMSILTFEKLEIFLYSTRRYIITASMSQI
jgi:hypothetical protein